MDLVVCWWNIPLAASLLGYRFISAIHVCWGCIEVFFTLLSRSPSNHLSPLRCFIEVFVMAFLTTLKPQTFLQYNLSLSLITCTSSGLTLACFPCWKVEYNDGYFLQFSWLSFICKGFCFFILLSLKVLFVVWQHQHIICECNTLRLNVSLVSDES